MGQAELLGLIRPPAADTREHGIAIQASKA
jgi:hypothetical protein